MAARNLNACRCRRVAKGGGGDGDGGGGCGGGGGCRALCCGLVRRGRYDFI